MRTWSLFGERDTDFSPVSFGSYVIATASAQDCEAIVYALCWDSMQDTFYQHRDTSSVDGPRDLLPAAISLGAMEAIISSNNEVAGE